MPVGVGRGLYMQGNGIPGLCEARSRGDTLGHVAPSKADPKFGFWIQISLGPDKHSEW